jgi:hypothetical protein
MTRSTLFNYVFGMLSGIALGAAGTMYIVTARVEAQTKAQTKLCVDSIESVKNHCLKTTADLQSEWEKTVKAARCPER